jgi:serine/threonine-protein kinase
MKARQKLGKYRIERKLGDGGFAAVYQAFDTLEGVRVALKVPHDRVLTPEVLDEFRKEVRIAARLKHPNILPLKNADFIDHHLVLACPLGERTLAERLQSRISQPVALDYSEQILQAVACAHEHRIIHCDIKPENLILFPDGLLKLTDFGIAKVAERTIRASGSGTLGYCAPEQAMGKPSFRSDVFSIGLIMYRMLSGQLPEWPFTWPPPAIGRLRGRVHPDLINLLRRAIEIDPRKRCANAGAMLAAFQRVKPRALKPRGKRSAAATNSRKRPDWRTVRRRQFQRQFGKALETNHTCSQCAGPVSETMTTCPWCGVDRSVHEGETRFPQQCPRCHRGMKLDWAYCPWCYGPGFDVTTTRQYSDVRYTARCGNPGCTRKQLMPFMRYCPWCRRKVRRKWPIEGATDKCGSCGWGVVAEFWSYCPWCGKRLRSR